MDAIFIETKYADEVKLPSKVVDKLPDKICLVSSVQFIDHLERVKEDLPSKEVYVGGQVLGCMTLASAKYQNKVDAYLYIGDGKFHPLGVYIKTKKPVFCYNPIDDSFYQVTDKEKEEYESIRKRAFMKFLKSDTIGVIMSTKYGQHFPPHGVEEKLKKVKEKYPDKEFYLFLAETLNFQSLEDFNWVQAWVNTSCPRIDHDIITMNLEDL